jgi:BlaI family penicillinase repressor
MKKLSDSELDIMMVIWQAREPVKSSYVGECLKEKEWAQTTLLSFLSRMVDKGFLQCENQGKVNQYTPLIKEEDYFKSHSKNYFQKFYGSSIKNMVAELYQNKVISDQDLEELKKYIETKVKEV